MSFEDLAKAFGDTLGTPNDWKRGLYASKGAGAGAVLGSILAGVPGAIGGAALGGALGVAVKEVDANKKNKKK